MVCGIYVMFKIDGGVQARIPALCFGKNVPMVELSCWWWVLSPGGKAGKKKRNLKLSKCPRKVASNCGTRVKKARNWDALHKQTGCLSWDTEEKYNKKMLQLWKSGRVSAKLSWPTQGYRHRAQQPHAAASPGPAGETQRLCSLALSTPQSPNGRKETNNKSAAWPKAAAVPGLGHVPR